jgi:hypothetical protein
LKQGRRGVSLKVGEKGGVSVYGLGRFPVTLYKEQWEKLLAMADEIKKFIADNSDRLKVKGQAAIGRLGSPRGTGPALQHLQKYGDTRPNFRGGPPHRHAL